MQELKIEKLVDLLDSFNKLSEQLFGTISNTSELKLALKEFLTVFNLAKFSIYQKVKLRHTPQIDKSNNFHWKNYKHFLIAGSTGIIVNREFTKGQFVYHVVFDQDSYIHVFTKAKILNDPDQKHVFLIPEDWLISQT